MGELEDDLNCGGLKNWSRVIGGRKWVKSGTPIMRHGKLNEVSIGALDPEFIPCSTSQINQAKFKISNRSRVPLVYISPKK